MSAKTSIEWTDATWNPTTGCTKVSAGCKHCYAEREWKRLSAPRPRANIYTGRAFTDVAAHPERLTLPLQWSKPRLVFVDSMSDLFHPSIPFEFIAAVFGVMAAASWHTFQVLTKRPERMIEFFAWIILHPMRKHFDCEALDLKFPGDAWQPYLVADLASEFLPFHGAGKRVEIIGKWPLPNVHIGVSAEDQTTWDTRVAQLLLVPAAKTFVSVEPMLGPITTIGSPEFCSHIDLVICGGESGPNARPTHPDWIRDLREQCRGLCVPFMFKQWGEWGPSPEGVDGLASANVPCHMWADGTAVFRFGKHATGRVLDGVVHNGEAW